MDTSQLPGPLPVTVARSRPLIEAVMAQSLREQGDGSRTASSFRWVLTGQGSSLISQTPGTSSPPGQEEITAEARYNTTPEECGWPPWLGVGDRTLTSRGISLHIAIAIRIESLRIAPGLGDTAARHAIQIAPIQRGRRYWRTWG